MKSQSEKSLSVRHRLLPGFLALTMLLPIGSDLVRAASLPQMEEPYLEAEMLVKVPGQKEMESAEPENIPESADSLLSGESSENPEDNEEPLTVVTDPDSPYGLDGKRIFNPDPTRAVWLSALFPGLGQIYNRRYWKLPIIVAGYMGLGYGTSWNARMYQDYQRAYADIMDDDPDTKSYLDFFPPTVDESTLDKNWLTQTLKSRKDYYRRNRDLCIICCVGLYLLAMLDAYVDASLTHFDVSDDISLDVAPSILITPGSRRPTPALNWAFTF
ncbi:MAG: hypothetical protein K2M31_06095 [Muribaculaceae bacterium]|nr:hypothetical protein [Muribaculaceae bacterium]